MPRPDMRIKVGRTHHDIRMSGRIVRVRSTEQSVWHRCLVFCFSTLKTKKPRPVKGRGYTLVIPPVTIVRFLIQITRKLYVLPLTVKNRPNLLENVFRSVGSSEVIFLDFLLAPGSHHPRFALSFGKIILSSSTPLQVKYTMNAHLSRVLVYFV